MRKEMRIHEISIEHRLSRKVQPYVRAIKIREATVSTEMVNERVLAERKPSRQIFTYGREDNLHSNLHQNFETTTATG